MVAVDLSFNNLDGESRESDILLIFIYFEFS